ncbi:hypothetical protein B0H14DRAFT_2638375 [Mycena olivaceomarginata]|nr:hypothetical protein B0H14DRAFT_2638375 [Mycena olivaceomarginata]
MASGEEKGVLWVKGGVGKQEEVAGRSSPLRFRMRDVADKLEEHPPRPTPPSPARCRLPLSFSYPRLRTRPALLLPATAGPPSSPPQPTPALALAPLSRAAPLAPPITMCMRVRLRRDPNRQTLRRRVEPRARKRAVAVYNVDRAVAREVEIKVLCEEDAVDGMEDHEMQETEGKDEDEDSLLGAACHAAEEEDGAGAKMAEKSRNNHRQHRQAMRDAASCGYPTPLGPCVRSPCTPARCPAVARSSAPARRSRGSMVAYDAKGVANAVDGTKGDNEDKNSLQRAYKRAARSSKHSSYIVDRQLGWRRANRQEKAALYAQLKPEGGLTVAEGDAKANGRGCCRYGPGAAGLLGVVQGIRYCMTWALGLLSRLWPGYLVGRADYVFAAEDTGGRGIVPPARRGGGCASR